MAVEQFNRPQPQKTAAPPSKEPGEFITYVPRFGHSETTKWRGVEFTANVPVRITDESHIEAARANSFYRVGNEIRKDVPNGPPADAMEYRGHVMGWIGGVTTIEQLVTHWAADRDLRTKLEVGYDDIQYLGTLIEPKLRLMRHAEGLSQAQIADIWIKHGVLDLPWRA